MRNIWLLIGLAGQLLLVGCAGVGIVATSDPDRKLRDAEHLWVKQDRPLPAERLISEAIEIYQKRGDLRSQGAAYRQYGNLLLSKSLTKWGFPNMSFHDQTVPGVTFENRRDKALEYFGKALEVYQKYEQVPLAAKQYDDLTNLYYVMAWTYNGLNDHDNTCKYFDKSLGAYAENIRLNPTVRPFSPGFNSFPEQVAFYEKKLGLDCNLGSLKKD
ncbi:MAG: hypothetical protein V4443_06390 [Pseudomonadota bacterium]